MNKYKISLQAYHWVVSLLMLSSVMSMAQTTIVLPESCLTCPAPNSVGSNSSKATNGTAVVSYYGGASCTNPSSGTINGTLTEGVPVSGVTMSLYANVTTLGTYSLISTQNGVTFAVTGTFTALGCQPITLVAMGTPTAAGTFTWCTNSTPQGCSSATVVPPSPSTNGSGSVSSYGEPTCAANVINGTLTEGVPVGGVTMSLYANVTTLGSYNITAGPTNGVTFAGSGTFAALGCQLVTLTATGSPTAEGTNSFVTNTTPSASVPATTVAPVPLDELGPGSGLLSGKTSFDVAISNNNTNNCGPFIVRTNMKADFTQAATNTQTYTFTPSGTVSNVRFSYVNTNGTAITNLVGGKGDNNISTPVTATVTYANTLNGSATGLTNSNPITSDIYVIYNDGATNNGIDRKLKLTVKIKDCFGCGAYISADVYKEFLCHNLGADTSLDPHVPALGLQGGHVVWGRRGPNMTNDSRVDWKTAPNGDQFWAAPSTANGGNKGVKTILYEVHDNAWAPIKTIYDPCPSGYRVPTPEEWSGVLGNNTMTLTGSGNTDSPEFKGAVHFGLFDGTKLLTLPSLETNRIYVWASANSTNHTSNYQPFLNSLGHHALTIASTIPTATIGVTYNITTPSPVRCIAE